MNSTTDSIKILKTAKAISGKQGNTILSSPALPLPNKVLIETGIVPLFF
jgi:hypothetical protein